MKRRRHDVDDVDDEIGDAEDVDDTGDIEDDAYGDVDDVADEDEEFDDEEEDAPLGDARKQSEPDLDETRLTSRLTERERQIGYALAVLTVVGGLSQWLPDAVRGDGAAAGRLAISVVAAAVLGGAVLFGRRLFAAIASVLASFAPQKTNIGQLIEFVYLGYGFWLMIKASNAAGRKAGLERRERAIARREASAAAKGSGRRGRPSSGAVTAASDGRPKANKRYTPPKRRR